MFSNQINAYSIVIIASFFDFREQKQKYGTNNNTMSKWQRRSNKTNL